MYTGTHTKCTHTNIPNVFVFGCFHLNRSDSFFTFLLNLLGGRPLRTCFPHFNTIMVFGKINCVFFHWLICCTHKVSHTCVGAARKVWVAKFKTRTSPAFSWLHSFARLLFLLSPWKCPGVPHREAFGLTCGSFVCSWVVNRTDLITFPRSCCLFFCFFFGTPWVGTPSVEFWGSASGQSTVFSSTGSSVAHTKCHTYKQQ